MKFYTDWEEFKDARLCNAWVATAVIGASVIGAGASIYSSNKASQAQTDASQAGINATTKMYNQTREDLAPYRTAGTDAYNKLKDANFYTDPIVMDQATLEQTPGYEFTKTQGVKAVQNSAAARGLGVSGAALKGAANFTTGLADKTYLDQFNVANTNQSNAYSRLKGLIDTGASAAAGQATSNTNTGTAVAGLTVGAGNAQAAAANATGGAINKGFSDIGGYAAYKGLYGNNNPSSYDVYGSGAATGGNNGGTVWAT